jgi:ATP-binding protein involved in chromosome partitioning
VGIVENMSYLVCPHCRECIDVFSHGGGRRTAAEMKVHFLAELPLNPAVRVGGDSGKPIVLEEDPRKAGAGFLELARNTIARIEEIGPQEGPRIEITD